MIPMLRDNDLWFKIDGIDKTYYRPKAYPYSSSGSCAYDLTRNDDLTNGKENAGGVLRAYTSDPDA